MFDIRKRRISGGPNVYAHYSSKYGITLAEVLLSFLALSLLHERQRGCVRIRSRRKGRERENTFRSLGIPTKKLLLGLSSFGRKNKKGSLCQYYVGALQVRGILSLECWPTERVGTVLRTVPSTEVLGCPKYKVQKIELYVLYNVPSYPHLIWRACYLRRLVQFLGECTYVL